MQTIDEILFENIDVAASMLSYLLINVGGDVAIQEELRREARQYTENSKSDSDFEAYLARSNTFLDFCCTESRRLCSLLCELSSFLETSIPYS